MYALMGTAGLGLMAVIAAMFYRGEMLAREAQVIGLQAENKTLISSVETIKGVNKKVNETLSFTLIMHRNQLGKADEYRKELTVSENKTRQILLEIDDLRRTEHKKALEEPFERGNAARSRIINIVCRAWGDNNNPQCSSSRNNGDAGTNDRDKDKSRTDADSSTNSSDNIKTSKILP